jgi:glycosyltransferase involved in cell wall biosynthesis
MTSSIDASAPAVSVVIPAYNRAATIRAAVQSVLGQTLSDIEVIVVDDGSQDATLEVASGIADPRLRVIASPRNMGASAARNLGVREARAEWVAFQDSDDEWLPSKLAKQMARLSAPGADYVAAYCRMLILGTPDQPGELVSRSGKLTAQYFPAAGERDLDGDLTLPLLRGSLISTQTLVARRDRLLDIGGFDPDLPALIDWDCVLRLAPLGPIAFVDEPLVIQRFSANSITRDRARSHKARMRIVDKQAALLGRHPDILARHHYAIAGGHRAAGDLAAARASLARARKLRPRDLRIRSMAAYVAALSLDPRRWWGQTWISARPDSRASK